MEPTVGWVPGVPPAHKTPFVETERFSGTGKAWRVWMLGDARCVAVHYTPGQRTVPCVAHMGECPYCSHPLWWKRTEAYAPVMLEVRKLPNPEWVPLLAIFTAGGYKQLGPTPHRGKMFDVSRKNRGERCSQLVVKQLQVSDPLRPSFDIEPLIKRLWWPDAAQGVPVELPASIPIPPEEVHRPAFEPEPQPVTLSPEEAARLVPKLEASGFKNLASKVAAEVPPVKPVTPVKEPKTPNANQRDGTGEQLAELRKKPAEELTADEAVASNRIVDYVAAGLPAVDALPFSRNGKKGGAR